MKDLVFQPATALARLLRTRKLSATELTRAFIAQVERVNPKVNALVTFLPELALKQAKALDLRDERPRQLGRGKLARPEEAGERGRRLEDEIFHHMSTMSNCSCV